MKFALGFLVGCCCTVVTGILVSQYHLWQADHARFSKMAPASATVKIYVAQDPTATVAHTDLATILDHVDGLTAVEQKFIRDGAASGLITNVQLQATVHGETRFVTVPLNSPGILIRGSSEAHFGPTKLILERPPHQPVHTGSASGR
ncbi:MAG TPA: hypothetical protein VHE61_14885 [Opitutaceae bacterium]|nr:hypothetical protein [Opitutaceae bacterium]